MPPLQSGTFLHAFMAWQSGYVCTSFDCNLVLRDGRSQIRQLKCNIVWQRACQCLVYCWTVNPIPCLKSIAEQWTPVACKQLLNSGPLSCLQTEHIVLFSIYGAIFWNLLDNGHAWWWCCAMLKFEQMLLLFSSKHLFASRSKSLHCFILEPQNKCRKTEMIAPIARLIFHYR